MEKRWLVKTGHSDLMIFALGWACEPQSVVHIPLKGYDVLCLYDYRHPETFTLPEIDTYRTIDLMAWSFGVMIAERLCPHLPLRRAIALNGTPRPVDDHFGIPVRSFRLTLRSIGTAGTTLFEQRTYGDSYATASTWPPSRSLDDKVEELKTLATLADQPPIVPDWRWHTALIGGQDAIFPPQNQLAYWQAYDPSIRILEMPEVPHYPFCDFRPILSLLHP